MTAAFFKTNEQFSLNLMHVICAFTVSNAIFAVYLNHLVDENFIQQNQGFRIIQNFLMFTLVSVLIHKKGNLFN